MKKKLVIFDLDGTLLNTSEGIVRCHQYAHTEMGKTPPSEAALRQVIGAALFDTYVTTFGFSETDARRAVDIYRDRYAEKGVHEAYVYPGIKALLQNLKSDGLSLMVATLKKEEFAKRMLAEFGIASYFTCIFGMDGKDKKRKVDLLLQCVRKADVDISDAVLVGDSFYDYQGATECGMDFVGVTYGFGFHDDVVSDAVLCEDAANVYQCIQKM